MSGEGLFQLGVLEVLQRPSSLFDGNYSLGSFQGRVLIELVEGLLGLQHRQLGAGKIRGAFSGGLISLQSGQHVTRLDFIASLDEDFYQLAAFLET